MLFLMFFFSCILSKFKLERIASFRLALRVVTVVLLTSVTGSPLTLLKIRRIWWLEEEEEEVMKQLEAKSKPFLHAWISSLKFYLFIADCL